MKPPTPDDEEGARHNTKDIVTTKTGRLLSFPKMAADDRNEKVDGPAPDPVDQVEAAFEQ